MTTLSKKLIDLHNLKFRANQTLLAAMPPLPVPTRVPRMPRLCRLPTHRPRWVLPAWLQVHAEWWWGEITCSGFTSLILSLVLSRWAASWAERAPSPPSVPAYPNDTHSLRNSFLTPPPPVGDNSPSHACSLSNWPLFHIVHSWK